MKLITYQKQNQTFPAIILNDNAYDLSKHFSSVLEIIEKQVESINNIKKLIDSQELTNLGSWQQLHLKSPVHYPKKLLCVAGNYFDHIKEGGNDASKQPEFTQAPWLFLVPPTTVMIGHKEAVELPKKYNNLDYEGELAFIIGKNAKNIKASEAKDYIFGYTIFNDVSERKPFMIEHVENPRQLSFWYKKSFDTFGPCGPYLLTADEIKDPQNLLIQVKINDEVKQQCNTKDMIFNVYQLVEFVSSFMTLEAGDIISTGTPAGVGMGTGVFMKPGDKMQIEIDQLGTLENELKL